MNSRLCTPGTRACPGEQERCANSKNRVKGVRFRLRPAGVPLPAVGVARQVDAGEPATVAVPPHLKRRGSSSSQALPAHGAVHQEPATYSIREPFVLVWHPYVPHENTTA